MEGCRQALHARLSGRERKGEVCCAPCQQLQLIVGVIAVSLAVNVIDADAPAAERCHVCALVIVHYARSWAPMQDICVACRTVCRAREWACKDVHIVT